MGESWLQREFLSFQRLAFNFFFYGSHVLLFAYGWYSQATNTKLAGLNTLQYSVWASRGAGLVLAYDGGLILLPVLRNVIRVVRPKLSWLMPFDENLWFHRQVAYSMAFWTVIHTTAHYVNFINVERRQIRPETAFQIHYTQPGGITGHFMLLIMVIMYTTANQKIRHQCFEAFWYTHHLAFFFMIALYTHATGCFVRDTPDPAYTGKFPFYDANHCLGYESWRYIIWPGVLYIGERLWREVRARKYTKLQKVLVHPSGAMELRLYKPTLRYLPGQWIFLQVPTVSSFEWHPFSITSAPDDPYVSVTISQVGDWTRAVGEAVGAGQAVVQALANATNTSTPTRPVRPPSFTLLTPPTYPPASLSYPPTPRSSTSLLSVPPSPNTAKYDPKPLLRPTPPDDSDIRPFFEVIDPSLKMPDVRIDGPYGAPSEDVFEHDVAVLIGAGIGMTPFASVLKHIWYAQQRAIARAGSAVHGVAAGSGSRTGEGIGRLRRVEVIWVCRDANALGWLRSLLKDVEDAQVDPNFLRLNIYITKKVSEDELYNIAINDLGSAAGYDPLTKLRSRTFYGRPDFKAIYGRIRSAVETGAIYGAEEQVKKGMISSVGTFYCGPAVLAKVVRSEALACNTPTAYFSFAKEHF